MPTDYHHGVRVVEINEGSIPLRTIATAIIGAVCVADDADALAFPLNVPVLVSNYATALSKAGTSGTLKQTLQGINAMGKPFAVIVRVDEGATPAETTTNVIGGVNGTGQYTGLQALLSAQTRLGVKPRILGAPGLDTSAVTDALAIIAGKLNAMAYAHAHGCANKEAASAYRAQFSARELMLLWPEFTAWDSVSSTTKTAPSTAFALGLRAYIDEKFGWHKTISNVPVNGVNGISHDVFWDLQDPTSDAGYLNAADITTLIRHKGFRFWGSRTCSSEAKFAFESATRTAQVLKDTIAEAMMEYSDKPLHPSLIRDIIASINAKGRSLTSQGYLMGFHAWFDPSANSAEDLEQGKATIDYDYGVVPPLENMNLRQRITSRYLLDFATGVTAPAAP